MKFATKVLRYIIAIQIIFATSGANASPAALTTGNTGKMIASKIAETPEVDPIVPSALAFSPDEKHLAIRSSLNKIKVWDWEKLHLVTTISIPEGAHDDSIAEPILFSPNGKLFAACHSRASNFASATSAALSSPRASSTTWAT